MLCLHSNLGSSSPQAQACIATDQCCHGAEHVLATIDQFRLDPACGPVLEQLAGGAWSNDQQMPQLLKRNLSDLTSWRVVPAATAHRIKECFFPPIVGCLWLMKLEPESTPSTQRTTPINWFRR